MRKGISLAGNMIVDITYPIDAYPSESQLATITGSESYSTGGLVNNVIKDLARLDPDMPLQAIGLIGDDAYGDLIEKELGEFKNIDMSQVTKTGKSSITIVMNCVDSKKRTFFQYHGNNADFCEDHINWEGVTGSILHIGYILLLDALDEDDDQYGTRMARLLKNARDRGIKTSIDVVTQVGGHFVKRMAPAMKYTDYCIINEEEAEQTTGVKLRDDKGCLITENIPDALTKMKDMGVSTWTVIHCPEGGYGLDEENNYISLNSLTLPEGYIKGALGAGDAFCSGVLYGAEKGFDLERSIRLGICAAAASLSDSSATGGMRSVEECMKLAEIYG